MIARYAIRLLGVSMLGTLLLVPTVAELAAQQGQQPGLFARNRNSKDPINIESDSLELRDKEKTATFISNVKLVQGEMTIECKVLVVHYEDPAPTPAGQKTRSGAVAPSQPPAQKQDQQIRMMEASGGVVVTQKDQVATGEKGVFDVRANTAVITGNVVLTQGQNVVRGDRLWVDMNTNLSRVEARKGGDGRVQGLFLPHDAKKEKEAAPAPPPQPTVTHSTGQPARNANSDRDKPKQPPRAPLKLN